MIRLCLEFAEACFPDIIAVPSFGDLMTTRNVSPTEEYEDKEDDADGNEGSHDRARNHAPVRDGPTLTIGSCYSFGAGRSHARSAARLDHPI